MELRALFLILEEMMLRDSAERAMNHYNAKKKAE